MNWVDKLALAVVGIPSLLLLPLIGVKMVALLFLLLFLPYVGVPWLVLRLIDALLRAAWRYDMARR